MISVPGISAAFTDMVCFQFLNLKKLSNIAQNEICPFIKVFSFEACSGIQHIPNPIA